MKFTYLKSLMNSKSPESSKRFTSLYSLGLFTIVVIGTVFFQFTVQDSIVYGIISLILGNAIMTLTQNNNKSESITKDETKKDPSN